MINPQRSFILLFSCFLFRVYCTCASYSLVLCSVIALYGKRFGFVWTFSDWMDANIVRSVYPHLGVTHGICAAPGHWLLSCMGSTPLIFSLLYLYLIDCMFAHGLRSVLYTICFEVSGTILPTVANLILIKQKENKFYFLLLLIFSRQYQLCY